MFAPNTPIRKVMTMTEAENYWKKPDPQEKAAQQQEAAVGIWSRSRALRVVVWLVVLALTLLLALVISAYLSGFDSLFEMMDWLRASVLA
jgi:hypothetical protein